MLELVKVPDTFLKQTCRAITDEEIGKGIADGLFLVQFAKQLTDAMRNYRGIGIAAPQVRCGLRIYAIDTGKIPLVVVNPVLTEFEGGALDEEGCLSIPGVKGTVRRHKKLRLTAVTPLGHKIDILCRDLMARVCQHEQDHLDGILFTDRAIDGSIITEEAV